MRTRFVPIALLALFIAVAVSPVVTMRASATYIYDVEGPTAYEYANGGAITGYANAEMWDGSYLQLGDSGSWAMTYDFTNPNYVEYGSGWIDRATFPPANATIVSVDMIAVVYSLTVNHEDPWPYDPRPFQLTMVCWNGYNNTIVQSPMLYTTETATLYNYDVTTEMCYGGGHGAFPNWTAGMLMNTTGDLKVYINIGGFGNPVMVDYLGIDYIWSYPVPVAPPGPSGGGGHPFGWGASWMSDLFIGAFGAMGFIGMIAYPGIAIHFYKSGDDKLGAIAGFVIMETLFIVMVYAALAIVTGKL